MMKKQRGRPIKEAPPGKRVNLTLKVTSEMKKFIDDASKHNGRTQSQEGELLLEFARNSVGGEIRSSRMLNLASLMITIFESAGSLAADAKLGPNATEAQWMTDDDCYEAAMNGLLNVLRSMSPRSLRGAI
jgi:hypothetical protein